MLHRSVLCSLLYSSGGCVIFFRIFFFFQAEDGIRDAQESRGLGDVYKRQVTYAASAPLPGIDEYLFAGFLRGSRVEMVDCLSVPLQVPANAQIVLEGWLEPGVRRLEGPFGDHTGFYTPIEPFPALTVDVITCLLYTSPSPRDTSATHMPS